MMKTYLKRAFQLSDSGVKGLAKSIWSFFLYYVSFVPPMICVFLFADRLLNGNTGKPVVYLLFMLAATLVMYLVINYNYKTTYDETYQESANLRINLAEQLSKLPLSYFSKHNLSDLAQTIMADVASIEHAFANAVANSIGFAIYFLVISVALLIMNWKLGLCVLLPVLTSASVLFLTKKLQVRDVNKHYDKLRDISESFQNAIELNQEIKSYGLKEKVEAQMDQQLDESENLQWKAQITQTIPVTNRPNFIYSSYWNHGDCWPFNARLRSGKYPDSSGLYYYGGETQRGHGWCFALSDGNLLFGRKNCPDW